MAKEPDLEVFLRHPVVRHRLVEYLGGDTAETATAVYLTDVLLSPGAPFRCERPRDLFALLAVAPELARSLWDRRSLIAHLDFEHVCFDDPWAPLEDPVRSLALEQPLVDAVRAELAAHAIVPLHVVTGRGHHFLWRIRRDAPWFFRLVQLGRPGREVGELYRRPQGPGGERVGGRLGAAWHGLGKVMEGLAHRLLVRAAPATPVPLRLTAVAMGMAGGMAGGTAGDMAGGTAAGRDEETAGERTGGLAEEMAGGMAGGAPRRRREVVSLDISEYGDPLHRRATRLPYTAYRKGERAWGRPPRPLPPIVSVIAREAGSRVDGAANRVAAEEDLAATRSLSLALERARTTSARIPDGTVGSESLLAAYEGSELAAFHRAFYAVRRHPRERWGATYDRVGRGDVPPCLAEVLARPNDRILRPEVIQLLVRVLLARGWHPRHVAGLMVAKLARPHGWIPDVHFHEPVVRAEFYTRMFSGLLAMGLDPLDDFACAATAAAGLCPAVACSCDLAADRAQLRQRPATAVGGSGGTDRGSGGLPRAAAGDAPVPPVPAAGPADPADQADPIDQADPADPVGPSADAAPGQEIPGA